MKIGLALLGVDQATYTTYTNSKNETIFGNLSPSDDVNIPKDCEIWENGCTSCGANDGHTTFCSMVVCQYSKCLPHCTSYSDPTTPPDDCMVWHDGCNTCHLTPINTMLPSGQVYTTYKLD